jgi:hypothetical protein
MTISYERDTNRFIFSEWNSMFLEKDKNSKENTFVLDKLLKISETVSFW